MTFDHRIESAGRLVLEERRGIVYRDAEPAGGGGLEPAATPTPPEKVKHRLTPMPTLLFRYSALTFNGHRIHCDLPWAREADGYPGLLVHGPLQATLLLHMAQEILGCTVPRHFCFRGLSPLFDTEDFALGAEQTETGLRLRTAGSSGRVAMEAVAEA